MTDTAVQTRPRTVPFCLCLIIAPVAEVVEAILSPLTGGSTADDLGGISAAPDRFAASVLIGLLGTCLLVPALLGLAHRSSERSPLLALFASCAVVVSLLGFAGVRMAQAFELQLATGSLARGNAAAAMDDAIGNPIGSTLTLMFLGGNVIGIVLLAIALWRSRRVPIGAIILFVLFPIVDLTAHGHVGPITSHLVLLAATSWMAAGFLRSMPARKKQESRASTSSDATTAS